MYSTKHNACNPFQIKHNLIAFQFKCLTVQGPLKKEFHLELNWTFIVSIHSSLHYGLSIHNTSTYI